MADSKLFSTTSLAVCRALSSQFNSSSSVFDQTEARRVSRERLSRESRSAPEMATKNLDVAGCRDAASALVVSRHRQVCNVQTPH